MVDGPGRRIRFIAVVRLTKLDPVEQFQDLGILRIPGAFTRAQADAMCDAVWRYIEARSDSRRSDPTTWGPRPSFKGVKKRAVFTPAFDNPPVRDALDGIFGGGGWVEPNPGGQILMTFPNAESWTLPESLWHMDCGFERPTWPTFAVKLFALMADHEPGGGATLAIAGSHRLVDDYTASLAPAQRGGGKEKWTKFMRETGLMAEIKRGCTDRVVEMTGNAGDVYITHLHVFHCVAPNAADRPRLMLGKSILAA